MSRYFRISRYIEKRFFSPIRYIVIFDISSHQQCLPIYFRSNKFAFLQRYIFCAINLSFYSDFNHCSLLQSQTFFMATNRFISFWHSLLGKRQTCSSQRFVKIFNFSNQLSHAFPRVLTSIFENISEAPEASVGGLLFSRNAHGTSPATRLTFLLLNF